MSGLRESRSLCKSYLSTGGDGHTESHIRMTIPPAVRYVETLGGRTPLSQMKGHSPEGLCRAEILSLPY